MKLRDLSFAGCRVLAIYVALQAVHPLANVIGSDVGGRFLVAGIVPVVLFGCTGLALWARAGSIADRVVGGSTSASAGAGPISLKEVLQAGLWLLGIFFIVTGVSFFVHHVGNALASQTDFGGPNPFRDFALWNAFASAIQAGAGVYLVGKAGSIAERYGPDAGRNA